MVRKREGPLTLAKVDQWSMLGHDDIKEEKDKESYGKGEDKGKLPSWHVV